MKAHDQHPQVSGTKRPSARRESTLGVVPGTVRALLLALAFRLGHGRDFPQVELLKHHRAVVSSYAGGPDAVLLAHAQGELVLEVALPSRQVQVLLAPLLRPVEPSFVARQAVIAPPADQRRETVAGTPLRDVGTLGLPLRR